MKNMFYFVKKNKGHFEEPAIIDLINDSKRAYEVFKKILID